MSLLRFIFPLHHSFPDSKFNKNIFVLEYLNSASLIVDGLIESGDVMTKVWKKAIKCLLPKSYKPEKILLLGLAGGSNAHLINHYFPKAQITAVDIDPTMVGLGNKFFNLGKVRNLEIIISDALSFANKLTKNDFFDVVMVDCFIGQEIPPKLENVEFIKKLKQHSHFVFINRLWWQDGKKVTSAFLRSISPYFFFIKARTSSNIVISLV